MDTEKFLKRYTPFFKKCTPQPTQEQIDAIVPSALDKFEEIKKSLLIVDNQGRKKKNPEIQKTAENFLEIKLPAMLDVRGPTPQGSRGRFTNTCRRNNNHPNKKELMVCALCERIRQKQSCRGSLCDACARWKRFFFKTYSDYLSFAVNLSTIEKDAFLVESRKIFIELKKNAKPAQGKPTKIFIINKVIPKLKEWLRETNKGGADASATRDTYKEEASHL